MTVEEPKAESVRGRMRPAFRIALVFAVALLVAPFLAHQASMARNNLVSHELARQEARSTANYRLDLPQVRTIKLPVPFTPYRDHAAPPAPSCPDSTFGLIACWRYPGTPASALPALRHAMSAAGFDVSAPTCERLQADSTLYPHPGLGCKVTAPDRGHTVELVAVPHIVFAKLPSHFQTLGFRPKPGKDVGSEVSLTIV